MKVLTFGELRSLFVNLDRQLLHESGGRSWFYHFHLGCLDVEVFADSEYKLPKVRSLLRFLGYSLTRQLGQGCYIGFKVDLGQFSIVDFLLVGCKEV